MRRSTAGRSTPSLTAPGAAAVALRAALVALGAAAVPLGAAVVATLLAGRARAALATAFDWPSSRGDIANQAATRLTAPASGAPRAWTFGGTGEVFGFVPGMTVWSSPAVGVEDGRALLVVGSYDHRVYALDATSGERLWSFTTGDGVYATPVVWRGPEGLVVFATSSDRMLYALDAALGRRLWIHAVADYRPTLGGARLSSPAMGRVAGRDAVFFGHWVWDRSLTHNEQEGGVTALDAHTGAVLWRRALGDCELTAPVFFSGPRGDRLFLGASDGSLFALDAETGETVWRRTELDAIRGAPAVAASAMPVKLVMASKSGLIRCLRADDGADIWRYQAGDWVTGSPAVSSVKGRDLVLIGSYDRSLYALDLLTGALVWRSFTRGGIHGSAAVITAGEPVVLTPSWDNHLHAFRARDGVALGRLYTGRPLWDAVGLENSACSSPVAAEINGTWMTYMGSYDGNLYAEPLKDLIAAGTRAGRSNTGFWLSLPIALGCVATLALCLTWRHRRRLGLRGPASGAGAKATKR